MMTWSGYESVEQHIEFQDGRQYFVKTVSATTRVLDKLEPEFYCAILYFCYRGSLDSTKIFNLVSIFDFLMAIKKTICFEIILLFDLPDCFAYNYRSEV